MRNFVWIDFYMELADKLLEYKNNRATLIENIKLIHKNSGLRLPTLEKDNNIIDIDPFTFFALFNKGIKNSNRKLLLTIIKDMFEINAVVPEEFDGIPVVNPMKATFYYFVGERKDADIDNLWALFEVALKYANNDDVEIRNQFVELFDMVSKQKGISWNITMGLYWFRPYTYINLDARNRKLLENNSSKFSGLLDVIKLLKKVPSGKEYLNLISTTKKVLTEYSAFPELSYDAWKQSTEDKVKFYGEEEIKCWPSLEEYDPGITVEMWKEILNDAALTSKEMLGILLKMLKLGGESTCYHMAKVYGNTYSYYNMMGSNYGKLIKNKYNCPDCLDEGKVRYFPIPFVGRYVKENDKEHYSWKLRDELKEALEDMDLSIDMNNVEFDKNIILYGPPGTGKTYNTAIYAVAIIENRSLEDVSVEEYSEVMLRYNGYKKEGKIEFTTFHQSYGYEEFIEGIRPVLASESDDEGDDIKYDIEPGVFKAFCERALTCTDVSSEKQFEEAWGKLVDTAMLNGNKYTFTRRSGSVINAELYNQEKFRLSWNGNSNSHNDFTKNAVYRQWIEAKGSDEIASSGGKWLYSIREAIIDELTEKFALGSTQKNSSNYVFIVDEINRGNISKILGELITLIEPSKRIGQLEETQVKLPYSKKEFGVPDNVYIIGTMNTADRSIAAIDTALRRRFSFKEMLPQPDVLEGVNVAGVSVSAMLDMINKRIEVLYDREHTIGHAYFMPLQYDNSIDKLAEIFKNKIMPLLQEYFYEDYDKIRLVLGDNQKDEDKQFITKVAVNENELFGEDTDIIEDAFKYSIKESAYMNIEAYKKMI